MERKQRGGFGQMWIFWAFLLPSLVGALIFTLVPMLRVLLSSFQSAVGGRWVGFLNYAGVLHNGAFRLAAANTARFTLICIPILLVISLGLALGLRALPGIGGRLRSAFLMPMAVPAASVVLVWKVLFHEQGLLNGILIPITGQGIGWMDTDAAFWMLVISYLWRNLGYTTVLWTAGLAAIPESIYEAARVDGAEGWQVLRYITLPSLKGTGYTIACCHCSIPSRSFGKPGWWRGITLSRACI